MGAALALAERSRGRTAPNPNVGCVIVRDNIMVGRGWTQAGGRPHAEAMALAQAGAAARGATLYVTLEPCAHVSDRGPACADLIVARGVVRVVSAMADPDDRTNGRGHARLEAAGITVTRDCRAADAARSMAGFLARHRLGRPHVTLKLALSLDGCIALADGTSRWITGSAARAHAHLERAQHEAILVGRGTYAADQPALDVRLPGLEKWSPQKFLLSSENTVHPGSDRGWQVIGDVNDIRVLPGDHLLVEGGAGTAASFLAADLVDRLLLYRAPILIGAGRPCLRDIGLTDLATAHGRWARIETRLLGSDTLDVYDRVRG